MISIKGTYLRRADGEYLMVYLDDDKWMITNGESAWPLTDREMQIMEPMRKKPLIDDAYNIIATRMQSRIHMKDTEIGRYLRKYADKTRYLSITDSKISNGNRICADIVLRVPIEVYEEALWEVSMYNPPRMAALKALGCEVVDNG